jgi:UDP-galactopyranose mutase
MLDAEFIIIGSGLTGASIARTLTDRGCRVVVVERRNHMGGNVHDWMHSSGIRVHTYGPHYFRTSSDDIWNFVQRFSEFYPFEAILKARLSRRLVPWPVTKQLVASYDLSAWQVHDNSPPRNFEEGILRKMPIPVYQQYVESYTYKQWGLPPSALSAQLAQRVELRDSDDPRLKTSKYQGLPTDGYAAFMRNMLKGIPIILNASYSQIRNNIPATAKIVYTGPIDEFFDFDMGRLEWRGQRRRHVYAHSPLKFPVAQVNFPSLKQKAIRVVEWAHLMPPGSKFDGTVLTYETPYSPTDPVDYEYPCQDSRNQNLFVKYRSRATAFPNITFCGRLGEYRYWDMDQAIARAFLIGNRLILERNGSAGALSGQNTPDCLEQNL